MAATLRCTKPAALYPVDTGLPFPEPNAFRAALHAALSKNLSETVKNKAKNTKQSRAAVIKVVIFPQHKSFAISLLFVVIV